MTALTDAERIVYRNRLTRAENAYDEIMTGKAVRKFVDQNGESVEYSAVNISKLEAYIESLKQLLDCGRARRMQPRPLGFLF